LGKGDAERALGEGPQGALYKRKEKLVIQEQLEGVGALGGGGKKLKNRPNEH